MVALATMSFAPAGGVNSRIAKPEKSGQIEKCDEARNIPE
jgi:hypothetical protein